MKDPQQASDFRSDPPASTSYTVALVGSPNSGKTTLFNRLTGMRTQTGNYPGTTVEQKMGTYTFGRQTVTVIDLPGVYSINALTPEEEVTRDVLDNKEPGVPAPDLVVVMANADSMERSLFLISQVLEKAIPTLIALNMVDVARRHGITVHADRLAEELGCPVIPLIASQGEGVEHLISTIDLTVGREEEGDIEFLPAPLPAPPCAGCTGCPFQSRYNWAEGVASRNVESSRVASERWTERLDRVLTHPIAGFLTFFAVLASIFYLIFRAAAIPMGLIDTLFSGAGEWVAHYIPPGDLQSLLVDGVIGGVGGILVFLPQICILFFLLALLEDSGYLARSAFVMDRVMRRVGLPGTAFVPMVMAHACAIPAIMATRVIRDPRDRLVTILVAPLLTCSARIPVYAMVTALLFPHQPAKAAIVFVGAYGLGIVAALVMAFVFQRTLLPGESKPLVLELPGYRIPSLRSAFLYTYDRSRVFVKQAGSLILVMSILLWALATYPKASPSAEVAGMRSQSENLAANGAQEEAQRLWLQADAQAHREALSNSFAGRLGRLIEPVVRPLGFDWQIGVGILSSFAAREVIVSTLSIVYGLGQGDAEDSHGLYDVLRQARRADGSLVFTFATSMSLLVFYVLAMQCLPTQAITRRETGGWKWPLFQLVYMSILAYSASLLTFQLLARLSF